MCRACVGNVFGSIGDMQPQVSRRAFFAAAAGALPLSTAVCPLPRPPSDGADFIFRNGLIIPMAGDSRTVEALAIKNGKIAGVGVADAIMGLKSGSTTIVDLDGRALMPGFIDAHQHTVTGALINALFTDCGYTKYKTRDALIAISATRPSKTPAGQWLLFTSFDNLLQGGDLTLSGSRRRFKRSSDPRLLHQHAHGGGQQRCIGRGAYSGRHRRSWRTAAARPRCVGQAERHGLRGDRTEEIRSRDPQDHARNWPAKRSSTG